MRTFWLSIVVLVTVCLLSGSVYAGSDGDGVPDDGDGSGIIGDNPCTGGETENCDDNCPLFFNPDQTDSDGDGIGDACVATPVFGLQQAIGTIGGTAWESFQIDGETYLAVANYYNGSTRNIDSKIYKWDGVSFVEFQIISTNGARGFHSFEIEGEMYLAVANYRNDQTRNVNSKIYKWNGTSFVEYQSIATNGAFAWESFNIAGETFIAVANERNDSTYNINSRIYKWNGASFVEFQSIPTNGGRVFEEILSRVVYGGV
jgi:hypothetical protein